MGEYSSKTIGKQEKPIAVYSESAFSGICIMDIQYGIEDYVVHAEMISGEFKNVRRSKLRTTLKGKSFFIRDGRRYHLDEFLRTNS